MPLQKLALEELDAHLQKLPGWQVENDTLNKAFGFPSFAKAIEFVNLIARSAEAVNHHPDIDVRFNKVVVSLTTHDSGGLTTLDTDLAASADDAADALQG